MLPDTYKREPCRAQEQCLYLYDLRFSVRFVSLFMIDVLWDNG